MIEMKESFDYNEIPINDIRVKYGNDVFKFPDKTINYRKLIHFIRFSFPNVVQKYCNILYFTNDGISHKITDNFNLFDTIENMNNKYGILQLNSITLFQNVEINEETNSIKDENSIHIKIEDESNDLDVDNHEKDRVNFIEELPINNTKSIDSLFFAPKLTDIILHSNEEITETKIRNEIMDVDYSQEEDKNTEDKSDYSPIMLKKNLKSNKKDIFNSGIRYLSDAKIAELKEKYSNNKDKRNKSTRFSRVRGKNELCNSDQERDMFEEWMVISKANVKHHIKRYNEDTTLAIFFDKFSVNIRIRIQLYTHKLQKAKKTSQTFTFYKNGINQNWTTQEAAQKLENFLRFALENLFEIKGPINLDDF